MSGLGDIGVGFVVSALGWGDVEGIGVVILAEAKVDVGIEQLLSQSRFAAEAVNYPL